MARTIFISSEDSVFCRKVMELSIQPLATRALAVDSWLLVPSSQQFATEISRRIAACNVVIAVFSRRGNANILCEVGMAIGYGKPVIPIIHSLEQVPAMLRAYDAVVFDDNNFERLKQQIDQRLDVILAGSFSDQRVRDHVAQIRGKPPSQNEVTPPDVLDPLSVAIARYRMRDYEGAISILEDAFAGKRVASAHAYYYLADSYFLLGESLPRGERMFETHRKLLLWAELGCSQFPADERLGKTLGLAYLKNNNIEAARRQFQSLIARNPNNEIARYNMACIQAQAGELLPCIQTLAELFERQRDNDSWRLLARLDPDFDPFWREDLFQRLLYPSQ